MLDRYDQILNRMIVKDNYRFYSTHIIMMHPYNRQRWDGFQCWDRFGL